MFAEDDAIYEDLVESKMHSNNLKPTSKSTFGICMATEKLMEIFEYDPENYKRIPTEINRILNSND